MRSSIATPEKRQTGNPRGTLKLFAWTTALFATFCASSADAQQLKVEAEKKKAKPAEKGVQPRGLPEMNLVKEMFTAAQAKQLEDRLKKNRYSSILQKGYFTGNSRQVIDDFARWSIYSMTLQKNRKNLHELRRELMRKIRSSGRNLAKTNPPAGLQFRNVLCQAITDRAAEVLNNNFQVRINAILIISEMNVVEFDPVKRIPPVAFLPAAEVLVDKVIKVPQQPEPVKIVAVNGLRRIALLGQPKQADRRKMGAALIPLLADGQKFVWFQARTARALGAIGEKTNVNGQAVIVQALAKAMIDESRLPPARCAAARALGRADLANDVNAPFIAYEIARLANEMAEKFNADCAANKAGKLAVIPAYWPKCFLDIYFAFRPEGPTEMRLYGNRKPGLLTRFDNVAGVKTPFRQILPILSHGVIQGRMKDAVANQPAAPIFELFPNATTGPVSKWLAANKPSVNSVQPNVLPALRGGMKQAAATSRPGQTKPVSTVPTSN